VIPNARQRFRERLSSLLGVMPGEGARLLVSFLAFFLLLTAYYMVRPVRDSLAAGLPKGEIQHLALIVFAVMLAVVPLFGALVARLRRRVLVPLSYAFFTLNLLVFAWVFLDQTALLWAGRVFYIWITIFNLFVVSVFWSFMTDTWNREQSGRLFGIVAAGGSLGGLAGPLLTTGIVERLGLSAVTLVSAVILSGVLGCILWLVRESRGAALPAEETPVGGGLLAGFTLLLRTPFLLGIAALVLLSSVAGMIAYNEIARMVKATYATPEARTVFFSTWDFVINLTALVFAFLFSRVSKRLGVAGTLVLCAVLGTVSFVFVVFTPTLLMLAQTNCARRAVEFGMFKPARDSLYGVADAESRYKAKNAIDTAVYRGGDVLGAQLHGLLSTAGMGLAPMAMVATIVAGLMAAVAYATGRGYVTRSKS
jgi:AAA family ATP:ADP antiporter